MKELAPQTIVSLQAENVMRLHAVQIKPDGSMIQIGGKNGAGKTSTIDCIVIGMGGKSSMPELPIHAGETKALIVIETQDLTVKRTMSLRENGSVASTLTVSNKDGAIFPSPQAMLDQLRGEISFDPGAFFRMKDAEQERIVREITNLDFTTADSKRGELFSQRTLINRELDKAKAQLAGVSTFKDAPAVEQSSQDILRQIQEIQKRNTVRADKRKLPEGILEEQVRYEDRKKELASSITELDAEINRLKKKLEDLNKEHSDVVDKVLDCRKRHGLAVTAAAAEVDESVVDLEAKLAGVEITNQHVRQNAEHARLTTEVANRQKEADDLTNALKLIDDAKEKSMAEVKFPIAGLSFDKDKGYLTYNGVPLKQASAAEQLRVSVAIGLALNPKLKVLLIRDGSLLDTKSLELVAAMAAEAGAQVWVERVAEPDAKGAYPKSLSVVIEDGNVVTR